MGLPIPGDVSYGGGLGNTGMDGNYLGSCP
jgi:hypothetical protein